MTAWIYRFPNIQNSAAKNVHLFLFVPNDKDLSLLSNDLIFFSLMLDSVFVTLRFITVKWGVFIAPDLVNFSSLTPHCLNDVSMCFFFFCFVSFWYFTSLLSRLVFFVLLILLLVVYILNHCFFTILVVVSFFSCFF